MKIYTNLVLSFLLLITVLVTIKAQASDKNDISAVVESFKSAIQDTSREQEFYNLFLHDDIAWASVPEGKTKSKWRSSKRYQPVYISRFKDFYQWLKKGGRYQEKFFNVVIENDKNQATVSFDYQFLKNDEIQNWGKEYWTLLKVREEWKIASVLWTMNDQQIEKSPF